MSEKWHDWNIRVRVGTGNRAHLAIAGRNYTACGLAKPSAGWVWKSWVHAPDDWPLCKACQRVLDDARRAEKGGYERHTVPAVESRSHPSVGD